VAFIVGLGKVREGSNSETFLFEEKKKFPNLQKKSISEGIFGEVRRTYFLQKNGSPDLLNQQPKIFWQWGCCGKGEGELDFVGVEAEVVD
jgi:hypothetical protein